MKFYHELTRDERYKLTKEEFENYIALALAEEGYIKPEPLGPRPTVNLQLPTVTNWPALSVNGNLIAAFDHNEDAQAAAEAIMKGFPVKTHWPLHPRQYLGAREDVRVAVITTSFYDEGELNAAARDTRALREAQAVWDKQKAEHDKMLERIAEIKQTLQEDLDSVYTQARILQYTYDAYTEFLSLAENNESIALAFFSKRHDLKQLERAKIFHDTGILPELDAGAQDEANQENEDGE